MPNTPMLPQPPTPGTEPDKKPNTISYFLDPPYGLELKTIQDLPELEQSEITYWVNGDQLMACKLYKNRTKIKDTSLVAWLFMSLAYVARTKMECNERGRLATN